MDRLTKGMAVIFLVLMLNLPGADATERIVDQSGRIILFDKPFARIISLYGAHTENLHFLGLDREIIGVSRGDSHDKKFSGKPWFSFHDGPEKFLGAKPDLVLVRPMIDRGYPGLIRNLERYGITVVSLQPPDVEKMYDYWMTLGILVGKKDRAAAMVMDFKQQVEFYRSLTQKVEPKKKVYFEAIHSKMKTFTPGSMALFALECAGGINVAIDAKASRGTNIGNYGKEQILFRGDDIDVFLAQQGEMNPVSLKIIRHEPGFGVIKAVKHNEVYLINEMIVSRPGFRLLKGIKTIGEILYPEIFGNLAREDGIEP